MGRRLQSGVRCPLPRLDNTELRQTIEGGYRAIKSPLPPSVRRSAVTGPSAGPCVRCYAGGQFDKFFVKASVAIGGTFDKWDATLTFTSPDVRTAVLDVKIQADSVSTGSDMKNKKLKGKDFFDVKQSPLITFLSKKVVQTGPTPLTYRGLYDTRSD